MPKRSRREQRLTEIERALDDDHVKQEKTTKTTGAADDALFFVDVPKTAPSASGSAPPKKRAKNEASVRSVKAAAPATTSVAVVSKGKVKIYTRTAKPAPPKSQMEEDRVAALALKLSKAKKAAVRLPELDITVGETWASAKPTAGAAVGAGQPLLRAAIGLSVNPSVDDHQEAIAVAAARVLDEENRQTALEASLAGPANRGAYYASLDSKDPDYDDTEPARASAGAAPPAVEADSPEANAEFLATIKALSSEATGAPVASALPVAAAPTSTRADGKRKQGKKRRPQEDVEALAAAIEAEERAASATKAAYTRDSGPTAKMGAASRPAAIPYRSRAARKGAGPSSSVAFIPPLSEELTGCLRTMKVAPAASVAAEAFSSLVRTGLAGSNGGREHERSKKAAAAARTKWGPGFPYRKVEFPRRDWEGKAMKDDEADQ